MSRSSTSPVTSSPTINRKILWIVFGFTVGIRLLYFATAEGPSFRDPLIDGDYYDYLGGRLAAGEGFDPGPFWQPPLYPMVLGWVYGLFGHDLLWPRLLQACLDGVTSVLVVLIGMDVIGHRRWAVGAGVVVALHGTLVFYSGEVLPTTLAVMLSTLAMWLALGLVLGRGATLGRAIACGMSIGLGSLAVATTLVLVVPMGWLVGRVNRQRGWVVIGACLAVVSFATLSNRMRSGEWIPISANGGINLYIGNAERSAQLIAVRPGASWEALIHEPADVGITSPSGQDGYFVRKAMRWCGNQPMACVSGFLWKARLLLRSQEIPRNESIEVVKGQSPVLQVLLARAGSAALPHVLLLPLAAAGLVAAFRRRHGASDVVAWSTLALASMPILFFVTGRYRTALASGLALLTMLGAKTLWKDRRAAWREGLVAVFIAVLAIWPAPQPVDDVDYEAEMYYVVGGRRARLGDDKGAIASWNQAVALRPDYLEAQFNLGLAHVRTEQWAAAAQAFRAVLMLQPMNEMARELLEACEAQIE